MMVEVKARVEHLPGVAAFDGELEADGGIHVTVGPNGAGKTTLLHTVAGAVSARVVGAVRVLGADPFREPWVKRFIALARQEPVTFEGYYTVEQALRLYAALRGEDTAHVRDVVEALRLGPYYHDRRVKVWPLSFGTKRKLEVAKLLISRIGSTCSMS